jgi:hypothetical protein
MQIAVERAVVGIFWSASTRRGMVDFGKFQFLVESDLAKIDRNREIFCVFVQKANET